MNTRACSHRSIAWCSALLVLTLLCSAAASAQTYAYSDDFSTDKAMVESYSHSEFLQELPDPWPLGGFLRYEWNGSDRILTFYYGSAFDAYAWLKYRFPLDGSSGPYSTATVGLSLVRNLSGYGFIQCYCSLEGGSVWEWPCCGDEGPCTLEFCGSAPSDTIYIWFRGSDVAIDDLAVVLSGETAGGCVSWTAIKSLFR